MTLCVKSESDFWNGKPPISMEDKFLAAVTMAAAENGDYAGGSPLAVHLSRHEQLQAGLDSNNPAIRRACEQALGI